MSTTYDYDIFNNSDIGEWQFNENIEYYQI